MTGTRRRAERADGGACRAARTPAGGRAGTAAAGTPCVSGRARHKRTGLAYENYISAARNACGKARGSSVILRSRCLRAPC